MSRSSRRAGRTEVVHYSDQPIRRAGHSGILPAHGRSCQADAGGRVVPARDLLIAGRAVPVGDVGGRSERRHGPVMPRRARMRGLLG
jgi:hypothetical protein